LQVWKKGGHKHYEKVLNYDIHSWAIQQNYLIYQLAEQEKDSGFVYIVNLMEHGSTLKVKDFFNDSSYKYYGICKDLLFVANQHNIKIVDINVETGKG
jgi:hypothetical protein